MSNWLENLKVGDTVIVVNRLGVSARKVAKITPTGRICVGSMTFNQDGYERGGDSWSKSRLQEPTAQVLQQISQERIIRKAYSIMRNKTGITYDQAVKIIDVLEDENEHSEKS